MAGIYVHVPFCKSKCTYCDFASFPKEAGKAEAYFACLYREMKGWKDALAGKTFQSVYFGGGTPSFVEENLIAGAMKQLKNCFRIAPDAEITIECNPGTLTEKKVAAYRAAGINRYSIGLQSGIDAQLKRLNRIHTAKDFLVSCQMLKGENCSADLLIGLAGQTQDDLKKSVDLALAGGVRHVSMYALTPEPGTPIYSDYLNGLLPDGDETADLYDFGREYLRQAGFFRYEVSNFAQKGFASRHNLNYWWRGEYIGFGVSASSFIDERRFTNSYSVDEYMNAVIYNRRPEIFSENVSAEDAKFEFIMLGLRTAEGIDLDEFNFRFAADFEQEYRDALAKHAPYLDRKGRRIAIKEAYLYTQNQILMDFMKN